MKPIECGATEWRYDEDGNELELAPAYWCILPPGHPGPHWDQDEGWEW